MREVADDDRCRVLAKDYVATVAAGKSALVVSPTHREGEKITAEIRSELKKLGRLKTRNGRYSSCKTRTSRKAQRADDVNYLPGDVLEFHQNAKGSAKASAWSSGSRNCRSARRQGSRHSMPVNCALRRGTLCGSPKTV